MKFSAVRKRESLPQFELGEKERPMGCLKSISNTLVNSKIILLRKVRKAPSITIEGQGRRGEDDRHQSLSRPEVERSDEIIRRCR